MASVDPVAQSVEHNTFNVGVPGSSPGGITEEIAVEFLLCRYFFCSEIASGQLYVNIMIVLWVGV